MAIACFCGYPSRLSVEIFAEISFLEEPSFNGISYSL
jgi:hypothetical protein